MRRADPAVPRAEAGSGTPGRDRPAGGRGVGTVDEQQPVPRMKDPGDQAASASAPDGLRRDAYRAG